MKIKGSARKNGFIKRLCEESLILSCLGKLSSRLIYFLKASMASFLLTGSASTDEKLKNGLAGSYLEKYKVKKRVVTPAKRAFSLSVEEGIITKYYRAWLERALYTSAKSYGVFLLTFSIYIAIVHFIKTNNLNAIVSSQSLLVAFITLVLSVPFIVSRKSLVMFFRGSAFINGMLSECIDLDRYDSKRKSSAFAVAIFAGSVLGALCFFTTETRIIVFLAGIIYTLAVFHSPELGVFSVAFAFPFANKLVVSLMATVSFVSYVVKVLRGKRSIHSGAAGVFVGILGAAFFFVFLKGGGEKALFAFCMCALYILASNLLSTPALLKKMVSSFVKGLSLCCLAFSLQMFDGAFHGEAADKVLTSSFSVFSSSSTFGGYVILMLPFMFCKASRGKFFSKFFSYLLFVGLISYSVYLGHAVLALLAAVCLAVYMAISNGNLFRPLFFAFGLPVGGLYFANVPITYSGLGIYDLMSGWTAAAAAASPHFFLGVGMAEESVTLAFDGSSNNMFLQIFLECGALGYLLLVLAVVFALQRVYASLGEIGSENRVITAAAGASVLSGLALGFGTNLWSTPSLCTAFWLCLGMAGAAYRLRMADRRGTDERF